MEPAHVVAIGGAGAFAVHGAVAERHVENGRRRLGGKPAQRRGTRFAVRRRADTPGGECRRDQRSEAAPRSGPATSRNLLVPDPDAPGYLSRAPRWVTMSRKRSTSTLICSTSAGRKPPAAKWPVMESGLIVTVRTSRM